MSEESREPKTWSMPGGREERSTELHFELGSAAEPILVRVTSLHRDRKSGRFGSRHGYILYSSQGTVLIDPTEPTPDVQAAFDALATRPSAGPLATVVTSSWHERSSYLMRERLGAAVWLPRAGVAEKEGEPDHLYDENTTLPGGLRAMTIDDRFAGDTALYWTAPGGERVLFGGDVVIGGSAMPGHWRREPGIHLYMFGPLDEDRFLSSFSRLLDEPVDMVCSAHGSPMPFRDDPNGTIERLVKEGVFHPPLPSGLGAGRSLALPT
jgi:hypothetical protein